jgi:hypothetical protein
MYKLTNVSTDFRYAAQRRTAPRLQMEPMIGSTKLRMGKSLKISDAHFKRNESSINMHKRHGVLVYEQLSVDDPSQAEAPAIEIAGPPVSGENAVVESTAAVVETPTPAEPVEEVVEVAPPAPPPVPEVVEEKPQPEVRTSSGGKKDKRR